MGRPGIGGTETSRKKAYGKESFRNVLGMASVWVTLEHRLYGWEKEWDKGPVTSTSLKWAVWTT